jgi:hypothetical protein
MQTQDALITPSRKKSKFQKYRTKKEYWKVRVSHKGNPIRIRVDLLAETIKARKHGLVHFKPKTIAKQDY